MFYVPVNSNDHVWTLPPFYGHQDVMTLKNNRPTKPIRFICMDGLTKPHFLGRLRHEQLISNQMVGQ